jgi:hypothetical protein
MISGTSIAVLACTALMQLASAEASRLSGENTAQIWVECLDDYVVIDYEFNRVRVDHKDGRNYTIRQKGVATDSYGNTWKFSGHYQFKTKYSENPTVEHWIDRNILVSQQPDVPNLHIMTTGNLVTANGDLAADIFVETVSCIGR